MVEISDAVPSSRSEGWTRGRIVFLSISAAVVVAILVAVREVLLPFILALIIAYVLTPLVAWGESRLRLPRSLSILLVYALVIGTIALGITAMAPRIYGETVRFAREAPALARATAHKQGEKIESWVKAYQDKQPKPVVKKPRAPALLVEKVGDGYAVKLGSGAIVVQEAENRWKIAPLQSEPPKDFQVTELFDQGTEQLIDYARLNAFQFIKLGQSLLVTFTRGIFLVFMTLMVAGYVMHTRERVLGFFRSLPPRMYRPGFDFLLKRIDRGLSGVVRGQLLICLVNGILSAIGFALFGLKYWPVLALIAGIMSIIPIFGSILSTIPAVAIGLTQDVWTALWVLLWIVGIHQIEANLLNPKIIGVAAKLHPVLVVFALLVGEHFFGLWGALLGVPVLSVGQSVFNHFRYALPDVEADSLRAPEINSARYR